MELVDDFYNKLCAELDLTYFPNLVYYGDSKRCSKVHYRVELFNNGCISYFRLIKSVATLCNTDIDTIKQIVDKYILIG